MLSRAVLAVRSAGLPPRGSAAPRHAAWRSALPDRAFAAGAAGVARAAEPARVSVII